MRVNKEVYTPTEQVGNFEEIVSSIRHQDLGMALDAVSRNLYSNPIGSFVRELVSNGVDANRRNDIAESVNVHIYKEDGTWYFQVTDEGKGMTPETFREVYMKWFNSDKRDNNEDIGGWGIGSKSPLSYVESYELTTIAEGIKYEYIIIRQSPAPTATLLSSSPTTEKSGTKVRLEIKEDDLYSLYEESKQQLTYFKNVIVKNDRYFYDNNFKILEHELFMVRNGDYPFGYDMHIVLGQVAYPINWNYLGIERIKCPVGIKFNTGDLPVTLSREEINYDEQVKQLLLSRINEVYTLLKEKYESTFVTDNIFEFINLWNIERSFVVLGEYQIPFYLSNNSTIKPVFIFKGERYKINKKSLDNLFSIFTVKRLIKTKPDKFNFALGHDFRNNLESFTYRKEEWNHWSNLYYKDVNVINTKKITKSLIRDYAAILNLTFIKGIKTHYQLGAYRTAYYFIKHIRNEVQLLVKSYDNIPQAFIDETKEAQRLLLEERKGNIAHYTLDNKTETENLGEILDKNEYIFYLNKESSNEELTAYTQLFAILPRYFRLRYKFMLLAPSNIKKIKKYDKFKPAFDIFRVAKLRNFFIKLSFTNKLLQLGINNNSIGCSDYYNNIAKYLKTNLNISIITERVIRCNKENIGSRWGTTVKLNIYDYFKTYIDNVKYFEKNGISRNLIIIEDYIKEIEKVMPFLSLINKLDRVDIKDKIQIKFLIKQFKLTKLNTNYYGSKERINQN